MLIIEYIQTIFYGLIKIFVVLWSYNMTWPCISFCHFIVHLSAIWKIMQIILYLCLVKYNDCVRRKSQKTEILYAFSSSYIFFPLMARPLKTIFYGFPYRSVVATAELGVCDGKGRFREVETLAPPIQDYSAPNHWITNQTAFFHSEYNNRSINEKTYIMKIWI